jgi:hypothetical protein
MTQHELERVATLANHPGFHALLKLLDEADNILLDQLESAGKDKEAELLSLWRGSRRFKRLIEDRPEALLDALQGQVGDPFVA